MKKKFFLFLIISVILFCSCKNVKVEEDYYYTETENIDGMKISLKGNGYGYYGQLLEKYKTGSIRELMNGIPLTIKTSAADDKNASYNEIIMTFELNRLVKSFETEVDVLKIQGVSQIQLLYTDAEDKQYSLYSFNKEPFTHKVEIDKEVKSIILNIKGLKYYPTSYNSLYYKDDLKEEDFEKIKGTQINNEFTIKYIKIE